jgi:N-acetylglucosamine repressor
VDTALLDALQAIYRIQPATRRALATALGTSANRISPLVTRLLALGLVCEGSPQEGLPGRPAAPLSINPDAARIAGLDIGGRNSRAVLTDAAGCVLSSLVRPTDTTADRGVILDQLAALVETICSASSLSPSSLAAIGVGLQGIVHVPSGTVLDWPNTPGWASGWAGLNVPLALGQRLGVDLVLIDDTARAMGQAAHRFGQARGCRNFLYVVLGNGIGSAVFIDGRPYMGSAGIAGEVGHITVDENGPWCTCGNRGCLETLASTAAVLRRVHERLAEPRLMSTLRGAYERNELTLAAVVEAAEAGDKLAFQVMDETGAYIGKVLAIALNILGPEMVVLGGPLARSDSIMLAAVQRQVRLRALEHVSRDARIVCDDQGEFTGAHGAALLALDRLFSSAEHLARLLARAQHAG